jgi:hypothetical protein
MHHKTLVTDHNSEQNVTDRYSSPVWILIFLWRYSSSLSQRSLHEGGWLASLPGRFTHGERVLVTHLIGTCLGPRAWLGGLTNRKLSTPLGKAPRSPVAQLVTYSLHWLATRFHSSECLHIHRGTKVHHYMLIRHTKHRAKTWMLNYKTKKVSCA